VKFFVLLFLSLLLVIMLAMCGGFILQIQTIKLTGYIDVRPFMTFLVGLVLGYIIRDYSLRKSKK